MTLLILALAVGLFVLGGALGAIAYGLFSLTTLTFRRLRAASVRGAADPVTQHPTTYRTSQLAR